jgi:preprotein translocase subunit SecA
LEEDVPLEHRWVNKAIENAQTKVEAFNFDIRKHVVEYDDVMNRQREVIYTDRRKVLLDDNLRPMIQEWTSEEIRSLIDAYLPGEDTATWDHEGLFNELRKLLPLPETVTVEDLEEQRRDELQGYVEGIASEIYDGLEAKLTERTLRSFEQQWMIHVIDQRWINHLTGIDDVREGIGLRAYGQRDPLVEYKVEAASMFDELLDTIRHDVVYAIYHVTLREEPVRRPRQMTLNRDEDDGKQPVRAAKTPGRNDPCPCGKTTADGRPVKYKKCHGR